MKQKSETEKFLEGIKGDEQIDLEPKVEVAAKAEVDPEDAPESIKNRQHRRLEQRLQKEREANMVLNERLKAKEETIQNVVKDIPIDSRFKRLFGEDEKGLEIAKHFTDILGEVKANAITEAEERAYARIARERAEEAEEVSKYESKIEAGLESIEDEFGVDLTSDKAEKDRKAFLDFTAKIAPKDDDGNPIELPDLVSAYEIFKSTQKPKENTRRTEIAARSMQQSGQTNLREEQVSDEEKWLVQNGIIKPRRK